MIDRIVKDVVPFLTTQRHPGLIAMMDDVIQDPDMMGCRSSLSGAIALSIIRIIGIKTDVRRSILLK